MKVQNCSQFQKLTVMISEIEKDEAKSIAKSQGMTFAGWLGQLVKREIKEYQASISGMPHTLEGIQGTSPSSLDFGR